MRHRILVRVVAFSFVVFVNGIATIAAAQEEPTTFRMHTELGVQTYSGGIVPAGQMTGRYRFDDRWYLDVVGTSGIMHSRSSFDDQFILALALGPGLSSGEAPDGWEVRLSPRVTHVHHASTTSWRATPIRNLVGDSDGGVEHRTGAELAVGVTAPRVGSIGSRRMIWSADLLANFLPSSAPLNIGIGAVVGISLTRN